MKNQALFFSKDISKKLKCGLLQFFCGTLRVKKDMNLHVIHSLPTYILCRPGWQVPYTFDIGRGFISHLIRIYDVCKFSYFHFWLNVKHVII